MQTQALMEKLDSLERRYQELTSLMAEPEALADHERLQALARERAGIGELVGRYGELKATLRELEDAESLLEGSAEEGMRELAREEIEALQARREALEREMKRLLLPKDPRDEKDVILEIRAGTGGEEAGLFAADLFRMYARYAESKGWPVEVLSSNASGIGGFKEIIAEVKGRGAYSRLKYESGVHRVQRVPVTEASGRIHTSTATVAVLPEVEEVEVKLDPEEIKMETFHASGPGGQNVQKVATAVRLTHLPSGIVVTCQDERSQLKNRMKAMAVLRARLYDLEQRKQLEEVTQTRRSQVGSGERSEKIRTYNFPQGRVTDHRIGLTLHNLPIILEGQLEELIDAIAPDQEAKRLEESLE